MPTTQRKLYKRTVVWNEVEYAGLGWLSSKEVNCATAFAHTVYALGRTAGQWNHHQPLRPLPWHHAAALISPQWMCPRTRAQPVVAPSQDTEWLSGKNKIAKRRTHRTRRKVLDEVKRKTPRLNTKRQQWGERASRLLRERPTCR